MSKKETTTTTKEALIALWNKGCRENDDKSNFSVAGSDESPFYVLSIEDGIAATISATPNSSGKEQTHSYVINVIFGEFVEYARFDLDKSEYDSLADQFVKSQNESITKEVNSIVEKTESRFLEIIESCEV